VDSIKIPFGSEKYARLHRTKADYEESILADYEEMKPYLPDNVSTVLDIGCGLGGIDVLLSRHYPEAEFWLMDGTGDGQRTTGWGETMEPFNDIEMTKRVMELNGVAANCHSIDPDFTIRADLVISLYSWCFHYPASTYIDLVNRSGAHTVIVDVREGQIEPFTNGVVIREMPGKLRRMLYRIN